MKAWSILLICLYGWMALPKTEGHPLEEWTWRYPRPQPYRLDGVTWGNGRFVAVGIFGTIVTSTNGFDWTLVRQGDYPRLYGVAHADGVFVAVGDLGTLLTSTNGIEWTAQSSGTSNNLLAVAGKSGSSTRFLAVGQNGTAISSLNVSNWTPIATGISDSLNGITLVSNSVFLVVGNRGIMRLSDGASWSPVNSGVTNNLNAAAYGNGVTSACGDLARLFGNPEGFSTNSLLFSTTLLTWRKYNFANERYDPNPPLWFPSEFFILRDMAFGGNRFVAVGDTGWTLSHSYPGVVIVSDSGTNWTELSAHTSENELYGVTYGNGMFVAVGDAGLILVSSNGLNWTAVPGYYRTGLTALSYTDHLWIASGAPASLPNNDFPDFTTLVSSNGIDWKVSSTNLPAMNDLLASRDLFVGVSGGCVYTTTNGFDWGSNCLTSVSLRGIGFGKERFVVVGDSGAIFTSTDGFAWNNRSVATTSNFNCVTYAKGRFVAVGSSVAISTDGISWTLHPQTPPVTVTKVVYGNGTFVGAGITNYPIIRTGRLLSSSDGLDWAIRLAIPPEPYPGRVPTVAYANGTFLALSATRLFRSLDGVNWTELTTRLPLYGTLPDFYVFGYSPILLASSRGTFIAAGLDGIIMESGDTRVPILSGSARLTQLGFTFSFNPQIGEPYRIQTSTDLDFWEEAYEGVGSQQPTEFIDLTPGSSQKRFFRVVSP